MKLSPDSAAVSSAAAAVRAIVSDPSLKLSAPASGVASVLAHALESATGESVDKIATQAISQISAAALQNVGEIVGDIAEIVPVIGSVIKGAIAIGSLLSDIYAAQVAQGQALSNAWLQTAIVVPVDSVDILPADIFAQIYVTPYPGAGAVSPNRDKDGRIRPLSYGPGQPWEGGGMPAIGYALTMLTENSGSADMASWPDDGIGMDPALRTNVTLAAKQVLGPAVGLSAVRLAQFKRVRQAISLSLVRQADPNRPEPTGSVEGADFWPLYLDMLRVEFDAGRLTRQYAIMLLNNGLLPNVPKLGSGPGFNCGGSEDCPQGAMNVDLTPLADAIIEMVNKWRARIEPKTAQDKAAYATLQEQIDAAKEKIFSGDAGPLARLLAKGSPGAIVRDVTVALPVRAILALSRWRLLQNIHLHFGAVK